MASLFGSHLIFFFTAFSDIENTNKHINNMNNNLSQSLYNLLHGSGKTVATAESCTGGAIAATIVATSGASEYFKGGIVSYCNEVKEQVLGVSHQVLEEQTAVCQEVAEQMAKGARRVLCTDYAVSVTGIAGPGGGTEEIPVGTIWIGVADENGVVAHKLTADNGREQNLEHAVQEAISLLISRIEQS